MANRRIGSGLVPLFMLAAAGCGGAGSEAEGGANNAAGQAAAEVPDDAALLAQDPELANEAAADEAADMETFGGNAAAMPNSQ